MSAPTSQPTSPAPLPGRHVVLIGLRGAGKTTVGRRLARRMRRSFFDLDDLALARLGRTSVRDVFTTLGEGAWREAEAEALFEAIRSAKEPLILALGGGAPMIERVAETLRELASREAVDVILLECPTAIAAGRLTRDPGDRPSLTGRGVAEELEAIANERNERYRALATHCVDASTEEPSAVAQSIEETIARRAC